MPSPAIAPFLGATGRMMQYRKYSEASAVGFLSAILFTVFSDPVRSYVDFGEKWLELSGLPYQMNTALLGFIVGFGTVRILLLMRLQLFKMLLNYRGWMHNPKSTTTKMWGLMLNAMRGKGNFPTYYFQEVLPKLPVPDLNTSCDRFLASMRPILSDDDYRNLLTEVIDFKEKDGPILQSYLLQRATRTNNWLKDIWMNLAYLSNRKPIAVNVNCYATDRLNIPSTKQKARGATLIHWILRFHEHLQDETLKPQYMQDMIPMCMESYKTQFSTVRVPCPGIDRLDTYKDSNYIIITRRGIYYKLEVKAPDNDGKDRLLTVTEIYSILEKIFAETEATEECHQVSVFTTQDRETWAQNRIKLMENPTNKESLHAIEAAITVFSFDDEKPSSIDENGLFTLCGNGTNRWNDKSLTFAIFSNGIVGVNAEHTAGDATLPGRMWEYFLQSETYTAEGNIISEQTRKKKLPVPQKINWDLKYMDSEIDTAKEHFRKLSHSFELVVSSPEYGKGFIKKKRMSPDGYIQMVLQLAYYKLYQKVPKTYESASTRIFSEGRTETIRPVSEYSAQFVKSMLSESATREQKLMLLRKAVQYQTQIKMDACCGLGWDRHLLGLFACCQELKRTPPALFMDKNFFAPDILSTSQTPTNYTNKWTMETSCMGGGFFATSFEGYGVSYMIYGEDLIKFHVSCNVNCPTTSAAKMSDAINEAMNEMREICS
ncbi:carnitine O-palmitoyltransferase 1, liver isoform-like [Mytilus californianus]|uniref:carnitine O-palmitoyltransferase 1, liver isoform-like n=1 Tax=Mytilus californianus TaxID=6549 RepID=UPI00224841BE|nr:carnitine O-palmitoyltransferase 1, liver isoform-like [Mytilus californianus]